MTLRYRRKVMTIFHIFLITIGLVIIGISYVISEKITGKWERNLEDAEILSICETPDVKEQINRMIKEEIDAAMVKTEDRLDKISNEKIMAVSEYSDQVLEKIDQNHGEAVFLYNMLNEKEDSIKKLIGNKNSEKRIRTDNERTARDKNIEKPLERLKNAQGKTKDTQGRTVDEEEEKAALKNQKLKNDQILKLYSEGKSIIEIAKILEIGQGEIKLVIGLSQEEKA